MNVKYGATLVAILAAMTVSLAQPANNNFASATSVTGLINSCSPNAAYTTLAATADQAAGSCWSNGPNYNVWFSFTATATQYIKVQVKTGGAEGTLQNPFVALWNSALVQLNCQNYQGGTVDIETDYFGLTAGQTYYISVDNFVGAGYRGTFTLCLSDVPDYNFFEGAQDVTSLINSCSANAAFTTLNATPDRSAGSCWSNGPNYNRWFKFTATATQYVKVQVKVGGVEGNLQNPFVALWNSSLTQLNCQNYQGGSIDIETDYYGLTAGQTYYISVDNFIGAGYRGTFTLCLSDVPDYNYYEGALDVTSLINTCSANAAYSTLNATPDQAAGSCWSNGPNYNRWFKFTATATQYVKVQLKVGGAEGSMQNPFLALWNSSLTQLACQNYQGGTVDIETDYYGLTAGQTYYISVDNFSGLGSRGTFTLCLSDVVDYNFFEGALDVTSLINTCSPNAAYTTLNATPDQAAGSCWSNGPNYNRWFKFTASATQYVKVQVKVGGAEGSMQNPFVALWNSSLTQLACQNYQGGSVDIEADYFGLTAGQTYYISVDNFVGAGYRGTFTLCLSDAVEYNFYQGANDVTSLINTCSPNAAYTTLNATPDQAAGSCWSNGPNYNRWFKFTATATQYIKVQVKVGGIEGSMQNPFVALWNSSLTQLACQNYQGGSVDIETDYYGLTAGQTYYISVDNFVGAGYRGTFTLCLSDVVDYNFFEGAFDVTSLMNICSLNAAFTTLNATPDQVAGSCWSNGPNYNRWFKFTATATQYVKIQVKVGGVEGTLQNPFVALWTSSLVQLNCQNYQGGSVDIETDYYGLTAGQTYYISVDNFVGAGYRGTFTLCLSDVPDYNYFEGAQDVTTMINGCSANAAYTTLNATADQAAASCWSNGPNYNRWFKFTATATQYIKIQVKVGGAEGSMQNPFLALWNSSLTQLNCQNYQGGSVDIETDYFGLTAGQTYYISVDNFAGAGYRGTFTLCLIDVLDYNYYEGAITLSDLNNWCSANAEYSTLNATPDKNKGTCWSNGPNYNRWFKFTAITASTTVQVRVGGAEGSMQNPFVALWAANGTTQLACTNYAGGSVDISLAYASLTVGNTYYISVDNFVGAGYRGTFTLCVTNVDPVQYYSRANSDWSVPSTWSTIGFGMGAAATIPGAGNVVNIRDNAVTVSSAQQCAEVNLSTSAGATSLTVDNATLTINGRLIQTNAANNTNVITVQNNGTLAVANNYLLTRSGGNAQTGLTLTGGAVNVGQDMIWTGNGGTVAANTLTVSNAGTVSVTRDVTLSHSSGVKVGLAFNNTSALNIGRDLTFTAAAAGTTEAIFNQSAALNIRRNIVRGGTPYGMLTFNNASTLTFNGTGNQQVIPASAGSGGDAITFNNVVFNNSSGFTIDYTLGGIASIGGALTLTNGIAQTTSSNYINMLAGSTNPLGSTTSYVTGPFNINLASAVPSTVLQFPIGKLPDYRPVVLTVTHSNATTVAYMAELFNASAAGLGYTLPVTIERVSGAHYWVVDRAAVANLTTATATLHYGTNDGVSDAPNLRFVKNVGVGATWFDLGGTGSGVPSGTITSSPFTTFSTMTLGNAVGGTNSLPIELKRFEAQVVGRTTHLEWATASEVNNDYFVIERSGNGTEFTDIGSVDGNGNSFEEIDYSFVDERPLTGRNYYRLRQVDFDGASSHSRIVSVDQAGKVREVVAYPNPVIGSGFSLSVSGFAPLQPAALRMTDLTGRVIAWGEFTTDASGGADVEVLKPQTAGLYLITVFSSDEPLHVKVVVR